MVRNSATRAPTSAAGRSPSCSRRRPGSGRCRPAAPASPAGTTPGRTAAWPGPTCPPRSRRCRRSAAGARWSDRRRRAPAGARRRRSDHRAPAADLRHRLDRGGQVGPGHAAVRPGVVPAGLAGAAGLHRPDPGRRRLQLGLRPAALVGARVAEFRTMVGALHSDGLQVVLDEVFNHTAASGQASKSVLDRVVPGYYHRLNAVGAVETSTCCQNIATEHQMAEKMMVDSVVLWARDYKVDGFRFDLMGHHSRETMLAVREALDGLTMRRDGVDGSRVYLYGEGWNFGEVADNRLFTQATQGQLGGTGIGTFSDRLRDAVRGGGPFDEDPRI